MSLEFLKISKSPVEFSDVKNLQGSIVISSKAQKSDENNDAILELMRSLNKTVVLPKSIPIQNQEFSYENETIGLPVKTGRIVLLVQMESDEMEQIRKDFETKDERVDDAAQNLYDKLNTVTKKPKIQKLFEKGIGSIHNDNMIDVLKEYKHYEEDDSLFKIPMTQSFFMNDRVGFLDTIREKLLDHLGEKEESYGEEGGISRCDRSSEESGFHPLYHQNLVKQYLNATTPYRGLLLFHGLGSGKTCTSIGIIEAMKQTKPHIFVLTPASLKKNYKTQMKFCGSELFRKTENWEFVPFPPVESPEEREQFIHQVHVLTQLPVKYLNRKGRRGIYLIQKGTPDANQSRERIDEDELEDQINVMIENRFHFISYNGITRKKWDGYYKKSGKNPFDHSTIIIDEGHNFVSRIFNKLNKSDTSVSTMMYEDIINAENCNVVVLSGTPLINYPCEMGVLFNLVGGSYTILEISCSHKESGKNSYESLKRLLSDVVAIDYMEYERGSNSNTNGLLRIIRNPYGFAKQPDSSEIIYDFENAALMDSELLDKIIKLLKENDYKVDEKRDNMILKKRRFPDMEDEFNKEFIKNNQLEKKEYFQNKIIGLVSYIGDDKELMPSVVVPREEELVGKEYPDEEIFIEEIPMNQNVLQKYAHARSIERDMDRNSKKSKSAKDNKTSSYQIFSRAACNFVFPSSIKRPYPKSNKDQMSEADLEGDSGLVDIEKDHERETGKRDTHKLERLKAHELAIRQVLKQFTENPHMYFESELPKLLKSIIKFKSSAQKFQIKFGETETNKLVLYSPKFHRILKHLLNPENKGLHMLYSNFRTLEGIGLFKIMLDYYGYTEFKIRKERDGISYKLDIDHPYYEDSCFTRDSNPGNPFHGRKFYALYTGKEDEEEKEIIRNIFNGSLDKIPASLNQDIQRKFYGNSSSQLSSSLNQNLYGSLIQLLIISASGAEGIDLKNVRFVHIMEPYWHPVRAEQVIGRARRICSHKELPVEEQNVKVFLYLLIHNKKLLDTNREKFTELIETDYQQDIRRAISTDERLYKIMLRKKRLMDQFLNALKISAIDCHEHYGDKSKCLTMKTKKQKQRLNLDELVTGYDYTGDKKTATKAHKKGRSKRNVGIGV